MESTAKAELQRLKPLGFCAVHAVAKATIHKDSLVLTTTLATAVTVRFCATKALAGPLLPAEEYERYTDADEENA
jgi:hypothetical protein